MDVGVVGEVPALPSILSPAPWKKTSKFRFTELGVPAVCWCLQGHFRMIADTNIVFALGQELYESFLCVNSINPLNSPLR